MNSENEKDRTMTFSYVAQVWFISSALFFMVLVINAKEDWGIVLVDLRPPNSKLFYRIQRVLYHLSQISPDAKIELWVHDKAEVPALFDGQHVEIKRLNLDLSTDRKHGPGRVTYGYISKAYALLQSSFSTAFFFDADVWHCERWEETIDDLLQSNPNSDILWTLEDDKFGDTWGRVPDVFASPEVLPQIEEYKQFTERNTGTIFGVRKNPSTQFFLQRTIDIWHMYKTFDHPGTDQGPFRETAFLERHNISELLVPRKEFCRVEEKSWYMDENGNDCHCNNCKVVHYGSFFDKCTANMTQIPEIWPTN